MTALLLVRNTALRSMAVGAMVVVAVAVAVAVLLLPLLVRLLGRRGCSTLWASGREWPVPRGKRGARRGDRRVGLGHASRAAGVEVPAMRIRSTAGVGRCHRQRLPAWREDFEKEQRCLAYVREVPENEICLHLVESEARRPHP
jgi:hypothetical protein